MFRVPYWQFYFEGRPVLGPIYAESVRPLLVPAGRSHVMLNMASGRYNVDFVVFIDPEKNFCQNYRVVNGNGLTKASILFMKG